MAINFPVDCINEGQRLSYTTKLISKVYVEWFNARGKGMDSEARTKKNKAHQARDIAIKNARSLNTHGMSNTNINKPTITFPGTINLANEGSRLSALYALTDIDNTVGEIADFRLKMTQAKEDAINGTYWNPSIGDII